MADHGIFYWNELNTRDVEKAKKFYEKTIGWTFEGMPMEHGTYWVAKAGDKNAGGIFDMNAMGLPKEVPEHWMSYLAVDDVDKRLAEAKKAGATTIREPFDVPGTGRIAILKEPGGAVVGWMTPEPM
jgi:predicted enzyme related to lactoylglutathione lyase